MNNKVSLTFCIPTECRKILKQMALEEDKTMTALLEEMIMMRWSEKLNDKKNGTLQGFCPISSNK